MEKICIPFSDTNLNEGGKTRVLARTSSVHGKKKYREAEYKEEESEVAEEELL